MNLWGEFWLSLTSDSDTKSSDDLGLAWSFGSRPGCPIKVAPLLQQLDGSLGYLPSRQLGVDHYIRIGDDIND